MPLKCRLVALDLKRARPLDIVPMMDKLSTATVAVGRSARFPFRYLRLFLVIATLYIALFAVLTWLQGGSVATKLSTVLALSATFSALMSVYFVFMEARAMKQLGIPF